MHFPDLLWMAEIICQEQGGHVSFFKNEEELEAYKAATNGRKEWLGIVRINENQWFTMERNEITVSDWKDGEPNDFNDIEDCVETNHFGWNDQRCDNANLFSCRIETTVPFNQEC